MSTKALRELAEGEIKRLEGRVGNDIAHRLGVARKALAEVETIERAAKGLVQVGEEFGNPHSRHWRVLESIAKDAP